MDSGEFVLCLKLHMNLKSVRYITKNLLYVCCCGISGKYLGTFHNVFAKIGKFPKLEKVNRVIMEFIN